LIVPRLVETYGSEQNRQVNVMFLVGVADLPDLIACFFKRYKTADEFIPFLESDFVMMPISRCFQLC
jgi:hypothetical protein